MSKKTDGRDPLAFLEAKRKEREDEVAKDLELAREALAVMEADAHALREIIKAFEKQLGFKQSTKGDGPKLSESVASAAEAVLQKHGPTSLEELKPAVREALKDAGVECRGIQGAYEAAWKDERFETDGDVIQLRSENVAKPLTSQTTKPATPQTSKSKA